MGQPLLIAAWNFQKQAAQLGKKASKASKKSGQQNYIFFEDVDFLLGYGPMEGITGATFEQQYYWETDQTFTFSGSGTSSFTLPISLSSISPPVSGGTPVCYFNLVVSVSIDVSYSVAVTDYGGVPVTLSGTTTQPLHNQAFPAPNSGDWVHSGEPYAVFNTTPGSLSVTIHGGGSYTANIVAAYNTNLWSTDLGSGVTTILSALQATFESQLGSAGALAVPASPQPQLADFSGLAMIPANLGSGGTLHNYNLVCKGLYGLSANGDCNPADIIGDLICSGNRTGATVWNHGLGLSSTTGFSRWGGILQDEPNMTGSGTQSIGLQSVRNYCQAYGIYVSLVVDTQQSAVQYIQELLEIASTAPVYDGFQLWMIPYSEVSAVGGGLTYTPSSSSGPVYTLVDDNYITSPGESPITIKHSRPSDNWNSIKVDFTQRFSQGPAPYNAIGRAPTYIPGTVTLSDQCDIWQQGALPANSRTYRWIHDPVVAGNVAAALLRRHLSFERTTYAFKLQPQFFTLIPMDVVLLSSAYLPFSPFPVRITKISEAQDFSLDVEAEMYVYGATVPQFPGTVPPPGGVTSFNCGDPGAVNPPAILQPMPQMSSASEIWIGVSGASINYGGCGVWLSTDGGLNYVRLGSVVGQNTMGTNTSAYPVGVDPDATNTLHLDLTESFGALPTYSAGQRDLFESLCFLAGGGTVTIGGVAVTIPYELIAYQAANLTTAYNYDLPPSIRRGVYGTPIAAHPAGTIFSFLESNVFRTPMSLGWIGLTLYFKFTAFNVCGGGEQLLSDPLVIPYPYTPWGVSPATLPPPGGGGGSGGGGATQAALIGFMLNCLVSSLQVVARYDFDNPVTYVVDMIPSQAWVDVPPAVSQTFSIQKFDPTNPTIGTEFATVTFVPGSNVGTYVAPAAQAFNTGDILKIIGPAVPDTTAAGMSFTLSGIRVPGATLTSMQVLPTTATIAHGSTQQFNAIGTYNNGVITDITTLAVWTSSNTGVATMSVSSTVPPPGGVVDLLDWVMLGYPTRTTHHMGGSGNHYNWLDADGQKFWLIKASPGNPWDINVYDNTYIYHWITENASLWTTATAYKRHVFPQPVGPRYFDLSGGPITVTASGTNPIVQTVSCESDGQPVINLGSATNIWSNAGTIAWGGSVGSQVTIEDTHYFGTEREIFSYCNGFGLVQWTHANLTAGSPGPGGTYSVDNTTTATTLSTGGCPPPNFPCYSSIPGPGFSGSWIGGVPGQGGNQNNPSGTGTGPGTGTGTGLATGVAAGVATITAAFGSVTASATLTVT